MPLGIGSAVGALVNLVIQMLLVHVIARFVLGGHSTRLHLLTLLLAHYNKWLPRYFFVLYISIAITFITLGSPLIYCFGIIIFIMSLIIFFGLAGKIGQAYGFGSAFGLVALLLSIIVLVAINLGLWLAFGFSIDQILASATLGS